ncbi:MAG: CpsD/CapB family tyrosine-protein kinase [Proteobacteria bacterium]|nr:CpsD/CapB family tyrosine-protein kinase [Pseudomonadota bacterium]
MAANMTMHEPEFGTSQPAKADDVLELRIDQMEVVKPDVVSLEKHSIVGFKRSDERARPFVLLRTQISKRIEANDIKLIGITSATPNAGKSFVALNLAAALARVSEHGVMLCDFDLRRGSIATELGLEIDRGVSDFLSGAAPSLEVIGRRIEDTRLDVLLTNPVDYESAELVAGPRFDELINDLRTRTGKSIVLCDLPPAFANDEAMMMMQHLDAYVFVVDSGHNNRRQIRNALSMFTPTPCIGTVLNRYQGGLVDDSGYGYGYGKSAYARYY